MFMGARVLSGIGGGKSLWHISIFEWKSLTVSYSWKRNIDAYHHHRPVLPPSERILGVNLLVCVSNQLSDFSY
jgi:hypothetical protein